jgi:hypothetical protein
MPKTERTVPLGVGGTQEKRAQSLNPRCYPVSPSINLGTCRDLTAKIGAALDRSDHAAGSDDDANRRSLATNAIGSALTVTFPPSEFP